MSKLYPTVKKYYDMHLYSKYNVAMFVVKGRLTEEEYKLITGDDFVDPTKTE